MHGRRMVGAVGVALLCAAGFGTGGAGVVEEFDTDPVGVRATVVGSNQSRDTGGALTNPFGVASPGVLTQHLCSNWRLDSSQFVADGSRLEIPLGRTYTQADSFAFGARLRVGSAGFYSPGGMQMNFGLVNTGTTGMDRMGNTYFGDPNPPPNPSEGTTYDSLEWDFFPDNRPTGEGYPTAQQVILGTRNGTTSVFNRMAANFGCLLPTGPGREYGLPLDTWMDVRVSYNATTRVASVSVTKVATGEPLVDGSSVPDLTLGATFWDGAPGVFAVDALAIMNYQDYWAGSGVSLLATVDYELVWFEVTEQPVAEPVSGTVLLIGLLGAWRRRVRRE